MTSTFRTMDIPFNSLASFVSCFIFLVISTLPTCDTFIVDFFVLTFSFFILLLFSLTFIRTIDRTSKAAYNNGLAKMAGVVGFHSVLLFIYFSAVGQVRRI